jgi:hypothetical protein
MDDDVCEQSGQQDVGWVATTVMSKLASLI